MLFLFILYVWAGMAATKAFMPSINSRQKVLCDRLFDGAVRVALTRELGANAKVRALLQGVECVELPCIAFAQGKDYERLGSELKLHDVVVVSSPHSATVLGQVWRASGRPALEVVSMGEGTSRALGECGLTSVFEPSDATAAVLARELPLSLGPSVLYPTSNLAGDSLKEGLEARGFDVTRLDTYTTQPSVWSNEELDSAKTVDVVAFASPSAVRTWAERVGTDFAAVAIGPTSARTAEKMSFKHVISPRGSTGLKAWADLIRATVAGISSGSGEECTHT